MHLPLPFLAASTLIYMTPVAARILDPSLAHWASVWGGVNRALCHLPKNPHLIPLSLLRLHIDVPGHASSPVQSSYSFPMSE